MRSLRFLLLTCFPAIVAAGCGGDGPALETRTFELRHLDLASAYGLVEPYVFTDHPDAPGRIGGSEEARMLTVRERPDNLDRIARMLDERDRPSRGVTLRFQVIEALPEEGPDDPAIGDVETALREVFRFGSYRLVAETVVHAVERGELRQRVAGDAAHLIEGTLWSIDAREGDAATARLRVSLWTDQQTRALETTVNVVDGRTMVVGTAGTSGEGGALILTVRSRVEP